jgi:hypothetical protein
MNEFRVIDVIDGDTIKLSPGWNWKLSNGDTLKGDTIRIFGYHLPPEGSYGFNFAKEKLKKLLLNQNITLKNAMVLPLNESKNSKIACKVLLNDVDIASYFPEYKV